MIPDLDGEVLYNLYVSKSAEQDIGIDELWEELDANDQATWQAVAVEIERRYIK